MLFRSVRRERVGDRFGQGRVGHAVACPPQQLGLLAVVLAHEQLDPQAQVLAEARVSAQVHGLQVHGWQGQSSAQQLLGLGFWIMSGSSASRPVGGRSWGSPATPT